MRHHRTTARGALLLTLLAALGLAAASASPALSDTAPPSTGGPEPIVFPIVGAAKYFDDWGDPRGQGRHAGNDILTTWRSAAVAAEDGKVKFWTTSPRAGCMLYLYGASGTTYLYIHLNNDLTAKHDNRGKCVPGVAYADRLKDGARVKAGQQIAYNGDSGDAEGTYHLHFEVHPHDGADVDPFPFLNEATRLLFAVPAKPTQTGDARAEGRPGLGRGRRARALGDGCSRLAGWLLGHDPGPFDRARCARRTRSSTSRSRPRSRRRRGRALSSRSAGRLIVFTLPAAATPDVIDGLTRRTCPSIVSASADAWSPRSATLDACSFCCPAATTATAERRNSTISPVGAPGREDGGDTTCDQLGGIVGRDRSAHDDEHVVGLVRSQPLDDPRHEGHVRARQDRDPDGVGVLLDRRLDDLLGGLMETGVDHLHARVAQGAGDDLGPAIMAVEAGLRDHDAYLPLHMGSIRR